MPYRKTYAHNVWGDQTGNNGGYWSNVSTTTATIAFTNGRRSGWQYDAAGNVLAIDIVNTNTYDAASRNVIVHPQNYSTQFDITQDFDGDGQVVKWHHYNSAIGTYYYLRSSVLGGKIVTEIHGETNSHWSLGAKSKGYVLGAKLVRGAYMEKEATYAQKSNTLNPIQPDKECTDRDFNAEPAGDDDVSPAVHGPVYDEVRYRPLGELPLSERLPVFTRGSGLQLPEPVEFRRRLLRRASQEQPVGQRRPAEFPDRQVGQDRGLEEALRDTRHLQRHERRSGDEFRAEHGRVVQARDRGARPARLPIGVPVRVLILVARG